MLLFFGAFKLPGLARSLGQSVKIFKSEVKVGSARGAAGPDADAETGTAAYPPAVIDAVAAPREHASVAEVR